MVDVSAVVAIAAAMSCVVPLALAVLVLVLLYRDSRITVAEPTTPDEVQPAQPGPPAVAALPAPVDDWVLVWLPTPRAGVYAHQIYSDGFTRCSIQMVDKKGRRYGARIEAGNAAYELQVSWCPKCFPSTREPAPASDGPAGGGAA